MVINIKEKFNEVITTTTKWVKDKETIKTNLLPIKGEYNLDVYLQWESHY